MANNHSVSYRLSQIKSIGSADSWSINFIKAALVFDWRCTAYQWQMLRNHWNILKLHLFSQTTKQQLSNFEGWGLTPVAYKNMYCTGSHNPHLLLVLLVNINSAIQNTLTSVKKNMSKHLLFLMTLISSCIVFASCNDYEKSLHEK